MAKRLLTPVKYSKKADRSAQATRIIEQVMAAATHADHYQEMDQQEYRWWLRTISATTTDEALKAELVTRLCNTDNAKVKLLWETALQFLHAGYSRALCAVFVDTYFKAFAPKVDIGSFQVGPFYKVSMVVARPYKFQDGKMTEVL